MTNIAKRLGYGGSGSIAGLQVLITGGTLEQSNSPSYLEMMDIPVDNTSRSKVIHADGTSTYTGSINFDVTASVIALFSVSALFMRRYAFDVAINDGENVSSMAGCQVTNLSVSGAPGGLLTASISFMSLGPRGSVAPPNAYILATQVPYGYWYSGAAEVKDWTLTMNQAVTPMYGNENVTTPKYLKTGLIDFTLDANLYSDIGCSSVVIATSHATLTGVQVASGHHFNGVTDLGTYSHSFTTGVLGTDSQGNAGLIIS